MKGISRLPRLGRLQPLVALLVIFSMMLTACVAATPTGGGGSQAAAAPTEAPAAEPAAGAAPAAGENTMTGAWVGPCCNPIDFLNPLSAGGGYHWFNKIFSHLVTYDVKYSQILPDLAESWSTSEDGQTWTFKLRQGVTFHDGGAFTANDVVFSIEICLDPQVKCNKAGELGTIAGAKDFIDGKATSVSGLKVVDDNTLDVTTDGPNAAILDTFAETWILSKASMEGVSHENLDQNEYWRTKSVGTGPFKFVQFVDGQYIETAAFDNYWRGRPKIDKLIRREFKDPATALLAFDAGEIDFTYLTLDELERESKNENAVVIPGPSQVDNAITLNPAANPVFGDPKFHQAILYAIDRKSIIESIYKGAATAVPCFYGNPKYHPEGIEPYDYNPEKAKALLAELGVDTASLPEFVLDTYYNDQLSADVMTVIQANLADVGIKISLMPLDGTSWNDRYYNKKESQMTFLGGANGPDPNRAYQYFHSESKAGNNYGYSNPKTDELLEAGRKESDPDKRTAIYQQVCTVLGQDLPWIYLWQTTRYGLVSKRIANFQFTPAPGGGSYYDEAEKWEIVK
ncbi:MAG: ABC transporter substrate-binding protein [Caldilineaceae bacterium]